MAISRVLLVATALAGMEGCNLGNLFKSSGAACITDANCPSSLECCDGKCQADCSSGGTLVASVTLVTDFVPGYQFDEVQVELDGQPRSLNVTVTFDFLNPLRVGEYGEIAGGRQHEVLVKLASEGAFVVQRTVTFSATSDVTVPVVITRDCEAKACGELETCVAGACANTTCSQLQTQFCPAAECSADADCAGSVACAVGYCYDGMCLEQRQDELCSGSRELDQRCIPGIGCVVKVPECATDVDCSDGIDCTRETCSNGSCDSIRDDSLCAKTTCDPAAQGSDPRTGCTAEPCSADTCLPGPCQTATCVENQCTRTTLCQAEETCCSSGICAISCNDDR
ncbi:MAG: hypothetical protein H7Z43_08660 [Clostridia bacterium]|nr:hypothetical protein [Deltaproteobacteria bacterium]